MNRPLAFIIEDDPNLSEIFAEALTEAGFTAEIVSHCDKHWLDWPRHWRQTPT